MITKAMWKALGLLDVAYAPFEFMLIGPPPKINMDFDQATQHWTITTSMPPGVLTLGSYHDQPECLAIFRVLHSLVGNVGRKVDAVDYCEALAALSMADTLIREYHTELLDSFCEKDVLGQLVRSSMNPCEAQAVAEVEQLITVNREVLAKAKTGSKREAA